MDETAMNGAVEIAWRRFRGRLADALAAMSDGDVIVLEAETGAPDELEGAAPYVQFLCWDDGAALRGEVAGNYYLDERYALTPEATGRLADIGWSTAVDEEDNHWAFGELRDADRLAAMAVRTLREVHGVEHPAFVIEAGLPPADDGVAAVPAVTDGEPLAVVPESAEQLRELVDDALRPMLGEALGHDSDGDVPIIEGASLLFVHVVEDRPEVQLFAVLVRDVTDPDRVSAELEILNRTRRFGRFWTRGDQVVMSHELCALPFAPQQLRAVVAELLIRLDEDATDLARRVGGRTWFDSEEESEHGWPEDEQEADPADPPLQMLLELLHLDRVETRVVAELFDRDRLALIHTIVAVRTGAVSTDGHPVELVADHLRRALRHVVDGSLPDRRARPRVPPRPSQQLTLLDGPETVQGTLDVE